MALEPRGALRSAILSRRESVCSEAEVVEQPPPPLLTTRFHDEPETPIHPALEYEVVAVVDEEEDDSSTILSCLRQTPLIVEENNDTTTTRRQRCETNIKLFASFVFLVISGVGTVVSAKLQAIPMYNYPNFLNLFSNLLYIPICFAYIVPASKYRWQPQQQGNANLAPPSSSSSSLWPKRRLLKRFAIMGALDCVSTTLQTFAAVYLPGSLLILLPQAAIPVSLVLTYTTTVTRQGVTGPQWLGAATVLIGILVVLVPVLSNQNAPDFYCEAEDNDYDCTLCQVAVTEEACLAAQTTRPEESDKSVVVARFLQDPVDPSKENTTACRWLPFQESSQEKEFLEIVWSLILTASTVPMALSAMYKQRAMISLSPSPSQNFHQTTTTTTTGQSLPALQRQQSQNPPPALYVSGWIAVFQFICSIAITVPAGMLASPSLRPWDVPENLLNGMLCYAGQGVVETGCHPDTLCASERAALWVNVTVLFHFVYTISMMLVLKYSGSSSVLLFLALTVIVPIGNLVFALPIMPPQSRTVVRTSDLAGLILILAGLIFYRFSDPEEISRSSEEDDEKDQDRNTEDVPWEANNESFSSLLSPRANQTSYTLIREPFLTGDV